MNQLKFPQIMGILNVTPDSFSDGNKFHDTESAVNHAIEMIEEGADIIDIGGESTRPGSEFVDIDTEIQRVIPVIKIVKMMFPDVRISVDTTKYDVARQALDLGTDMLNDVSCMRNEPRLADLVGEYDVPLIIMHSRDNPKNMQNSPHYDNLFDELINELQNAVDLAQSRGAKQIIIDPGIGFAKNYEHNLEILRNLDKLSILKLPVLLGISRKSFIGKMLGVENADERDFASAIIHTLLLSKNVDIIRVHNVQMFNDILRIHEILNLKQE